MSADIVRLMNELALELETALELALSIAERCDYGASSFSATSSIGHKGVSKATQQAVRIAQSCSILLHRIDSTIPNGSEPYDNSRCVMQKVIEHLESPDSFEGKLRQAFRDTERLEAALNKSLSDEGLWQMVRELSTHIVNARDIYEQLYNTERFGDVACLMLFPDASYLGDANVSIPNCGAPWLSNVDTSASDSDAEAHSCLSDDSTITSGMDGVDANQSSSTYCAACGFRNNSDTLFCINCGSTLDGSQPPTHEQTDLEPTSNGDAPHSQTSEPERTLVCPAKYAPMQPQTRTLNPPLRQPLTDKHRPAGFLRELLSRAMFSRAQCTKSHNTSSEQVDTSAPTLSAVEFAAVSPRHVNPSLYTTIELIMYEDGWEQAVTDVMHEHSEPIRTVKSGWIDVRTQTPVSVHLTSPELGDIGTRTGMWCGRYLRFTFTFRIPDYFTQKQVLVEASVCFSNVPATSMSFIMAINQDNDITQPITRRDITSAFISYASKDRRRVAAIVQGIEAARPDIDVFLDVESLRSGMDWQRALEDEIQRRDILFLCWSRAAKKSRWVDYEWRYALADKGLHGIEPVAIEPPEICPPPAELSTMHFNSRLVYLTNAK